MRGFRVSETDAVEATLAEALAHRGPALVYVRSDPLLV